MSESESPNWHPPRAVLELAELVLSGALPSPPVPIQLPAEFDGHPEITVEDAEGTPVATISGDGSTVLPLKPFTHGPVRPDRRTPEEVRTTLPAGSGVLAVQVAGSLSAAEVDQALRLAGEGALLWLVLVGDRRRVDLPASALLRATEKVAQEAADRGMPGAVVPVAVPVLDDQDDDRRLVEAVARAYGATELVVLNVPGESTLHRAYESARERAVLPAHRRGVTVFLTGLSGSGKSTVARGVADRLEGVRAVSLLDGDEVRRLLSAGLGFSRADRDLNIRRIGFVATEVTRHGGIAICAPIAPFEQTRQLVREAVGEHGDFVLIHVSTPLAECERRDRKGLYAKARAGLIPEFTGISSPYEVPIEADLRLDTSRLGVAEAVDLVCELLTRRGYLDGEAAAPS